MANRKVYVAVTMDCERISAESYRHDGTASWEMSEKAIGGLADLLVQEGMKGVFLPTPTTAAKQARLFGQVLAAGHEVGMQFHCDSFRDLRYRELLGSYDHAMQTQILTEAKEDWEQALGLPMLAYRSGYFSASDATFPILAGLGVQRTSCSKPGRVRPEIAARWYGAPAFAHYTDAHSRLATGSLPLFEVPLTSHPGERFSPKDSYDPGDLRPDSGRPAEAYHDIVDAALHEMDMLQPRVATLAILTHNTLDYTTASEDPRRGLMVDLLRYIKAVPNWVVVPATLADIQAAYGEPVSD